MTTHPVQPTRKPDWPAPIDPAEIDDQRAKGWPGFHPETYCHKCGRPNPTWWIDSAMWNQTHGDEYVTILCPSCFTIAWEKRAGGGIIWELRPDTRTGRIRRGEVSLPPDYRAEWECRVYWGSHGCSLPRDHRGPHQCNNCWNPDDTEGYVGAWPYYGPETNFYGEDAPSQVSKPIQVGLDFGEATA